MQLLADLNEKQVEAVLSQEKRLLVLAGAGSGKTKTIIQKIGHLISELNASSSEILAITFTKNAANEMLDRLIISSDSGYKDILESKFLSTEEKSFERSKRVKANPWISNLTVRTFHSLCYKILKESIAPIFDNQFRLLLDDQADGSLDSSANIAPIKPYEIFHDLLIEKCYQEDYLLKLKRYILDYYVDRSFVEKKIKVHSYHNDIRYTTLRGEKVRSKSERDIADWLYRHKVDYVYEPNVDFVRFSFEPDFYIPQANVYLEHISDKSYKTADKEEEFIRSNKVCIKTFESMTQDSALFNLALERMILGRIHDGIKRPTALRFEEEFRSYHDKIKDFLKMVMRTLSLIKGENISLRNVYDKSSKNQHERVRVFYELALPLIKAYGEYCTNKSYLDFDDLILKTTTLLQEHPAIRNKYRERFSYVLVDEFQDVNHLQVKLLDLIIKEDTQLFCVGDDWQSIYGFRGSEVDYIINFENYFPNSKVITLNKNYRSTQTIVGASNEVIKFNKFKIEKEIEAVKHTPSKIQVYKSKKLEEDGVGFLVENVRRKIDEGISSEEILVLYRRSKMFDSFRNELKEQGIKVSSKTIHASKGLEAKVVFIIGLTEGYGGFPDIWLDDVVFRIVKDVKFDMLMEEERRLFYVAVTRAKDELFLITQQGNESRFIKEIPEHFCTINKIQFSVDAAHHLRCSNCKKSIEKNFKYCPGCGHQLNI